MPAKPSVHKVLTSQDSFVWQYKKSAKINFQFARIFLTYNKITAVRYLLVSSNEEKSQKQLHTSLSLFSSSCVSDQTQLCWLYINQHHPPPVHTVVNIQLVIKVHNLSDAKNDAKYVAVRRYCWSSENSCFLIINYYNIRRTSSESESCGSVYIFHLLPFPVSSTGCSGGPYIHTYIRTYIHTYIHVCIYQSIDLN